MPESSPPTPAGPGRTGAFRRWWPVVFGWLALVIVFFSPASEVLTPTLDGSNFASYAYFTAHHFQYGPEVVPMAGPYGFIMFGWVYNGDLFVTRLVAGLILNGAFAALVLWFFCRQEKSWLRWAWLVAQVAFTPFVEDLPIEWMLLLGGLFLLTRPSGKKGFVLTLLVTALLALLALIKGTQLLLGLATLGVVLGSLAWQRQWRQAALIAVGYVAALMIFWVLARQQLSHLPAYVRGILELGGGYTEAMSIPTPTGLFVRGLLVSAALLAGLAAALWSRRRETLAVASLLLLAGHTFVQWKHGIVRADGHAYIYYHFAIAAALTVALTGRPARGPLVAALGVIVLAMVPREPMDHLMLPSLVRAPGATFARLNTNTSYLAHPIVARADLEQKLADQRRIHALPSVRAAVGSLPIDLIGYEHGLIPLNGLQYQPRPMGGGSFNAYTPYLMQLNRDYVRDPARRPAFYLLKLQTIDQRLITQDDGLALLEILQRYRPRLVEHEHLLLEKAALPEPPAPRLVGQWRGTFGAPIPLPAVGDGELLLARFEIHENFAGKLRAFLYKPAEVTITLTDRDGATRPRRLVPAMARSPFIISPRLENLGDVAALYAPATGLAVGQAMISTPGRAWFAREVSVEFFAAPRPLPLEASARDELQARIEFPFANIVPESITPAFRPHHSVRFLHPPSEAVWPLRGDERAFSFHFGIDPEAYERGTTNGVEFILEIRGPSGTARQIFKRLLQPRTVAADRGDQEARVALPVFAPGSRLVLRTGPGEYNDASWDWAYANRMFLERGGAYDPALFPGFNRVPDGAEDENAAALDLDGGKVMLLHVPGTLRFKLTGRETRLALDFGFLPGAYTGGGNTAGAAYIVEGQASGQPPRELARRVLQPVAVAADRGPQSLAIDLPALQPGDIILVRTAPLPGGNSSWGWTYFSRLVLE